MSSCLTHLSQLSQLYPELNDVWINHFSPFIVSDPFHVCTWRRIVIEEMEMFFDDQRGVNIGRFHDWLVGNHFKASNMCTQSRTRVASNGTRIVHIWTPNGVVSKYVIDCPNHSLHQTCIRQYARQISTSSNLSLCAVCLSAGCALYFQTVETTERFPVCIWCIMVNYLEYGVLCKRGEKWIFSEVDK